jgi:uracil-DNA glycosylase
MTSIVLLGESWGAQEDIEKRAFVGPAGRLLRKLMRQAGLDDREARFTNVVALRPYELSGTVKIKSNKFALLCHRAKPAGYTLPKCGDHGYLREEFFPELQRLTIELELATLQPNVIVPLGGIALWALTGRTNIGTVRGTVSLGRVVGFGTQWHKIVPTYHPSFLLQGGWKHMPTVVADLLKARRQSASPDISRPSRLIHVAPTLAECHEFTLSACVAPRVSCDIETAGGQITHIGFALSPTRAFVFPFAGGHEGRYWASPADELAAWDCVGRILLSPAEKVFQNGMFDLSWLWSRMGLPASNCRHDTMLLQHARYPEMQKGLGYLGSLYTDEPAWKLMRSHADDLKRDE